MKRVYRVRVKCQGALFFESYCFVAANIQQAITRALACAKRDGAKRPVVSDAAELCGLSE